MFASFARDIFEEWKVFYDSIPSFVDLKSELLRFGFFASRFFSDEHKVRCFRRRFVEKVTVLLEIFSDFLSWYIERSCYGKASFRFARLEKV